MITLTTVKILIQNFGNTKMKLKKLCYEATNLANCSPGGSWNCLKIQQILSKRGDYSVWLLLGNKKTYKCHSLKIQ